MRKKKINKKNLVQFIFIVAIASYILTSNSCANQGVGPTGGPKDTIAPVIISSSPLPFETNFNGNQIQINFNEYVVADNLASKLIISPPLSEKVTAKTKGKSIVINFNEDLISNRTYSVDFKDGIKDYNEGNKLEGFRMLFSTYDQIDTLRIDGYLLDAFTLEPVENAIATLYNSETDTLFSSLAPDFIAKADKKGYFLFDNLPEGKYKLYGLVDGDNNLFFSQSTEKIAFNDSILCPSVEFIEQVDTIIHENDTIISTGYPIYHPTNQIRMLFLQDYYTQFLINFERENNDKITLAFNEALSDSINVELIKFKNNNWNYTEFSKNRDSLNIWITDTLISNIDSLYLKVDYTVLDSAKNFVTRTDTLNAFFLPKTLNAKSKNKAKIEENSNLFKINTNITTSGFDLNKNIVVTTNIPVENLIDSLIHLDLIVNDSTFEAIPFNIKPALNSKRNFIVNFTVQESSNYRFAIDSASVVSLNGKLNEEYKIKFKTQKADYY